MAKVSYEIIIHDDANSSFLCGNLISDQKGFYEENKRFP